jgi:hypothetical protein
MSALAIGPSCAKSPGQSTGLPDCCRSGFVCLPRALAAWQMLHLRGIWSRVHYGALRDPGTGNADNSCMGRCLRRGNRLSRGASLCRNRFLRAVNIRGRRIAAVWPRYGKDILYGAALSK